MRKLSLRYKFLRLGRSQMNGGICPVNPLLMSSNHSTEPLSLQWTPVQLHGGEEAFQFLSDGGFPHCCFRLSNVVCSDVNKCCALAQENSTAVMKRKRKEKSMCMGFSFRRDGGTLVIFLWLGGGSGKIKRAKVIGKLNCLLAFPYFFFLYLFVYI